MRQTASALPASGTRAPPAVPTSVAGTLRGRRAGSPAGRARRSAPGWPAGRGSAAHGPQGHNHHGQRWPMPRRRARGRWRSTGDGWVDQSVPVRRRCGSARARSPGCWRR
ncbi:hypothetical protein G6F50_014774 [Rhizopus delemar]|uniref:Uncharacterized protein n=1 Tax=Rhizopus delemar TaxID=936053 RepID=A0A9P6Y2I5_9FUNG|nr:hypothetical protein G6F50_014774 [Rhizopus delemar]